MKQPTERQLIILRFVVEFQTEHGFGAAISDIARQFGYTTKRGVTVHLDALERKGMIVRASTARGIVVTRAGREALRLPADTAAELREIKRKLADYRGLCVKFFHMDEGPDRKAIRAEVARMRAELFCMIGDAEVQG